MSSATQPAAPLPQDDQEALRLESWPLLDERPWSWLALLGLLICGFAVGRATESWLLAMLAALVLALSMWRYLLPIEFELTTIGIKQRALNRVRHVPWSTVGSYDVRPGGVYLFRVRDALPLDALRGFYVPWGEHQQQVLEMLARHVGPPSYLRR